MAEETTHYETLFIIHPVHSGRNQDLCERFRGVLEGQGATVTHFEEWGMRDLAYPIEKQGRGFYNLVQYEASAGASGELERVMRLSDEVMRCMTVVLDDDVRPLARAVETTAAAEPVAASEPAAVSEPEAVPEPAAASEPAAPEPVAPESAAVSESAAASEAAASESAAPESGTAEAEAPEAGTPGATEKTQDA